MLVDLFCCGVVALLPGFWIVGVRYLLFNIGLVVLFYLFLAVLWLVGLCYCWFGYLIPFAGYLIVVAAYAGGSVGSVGEFVFVRIWLPV